MEQIINEMPIWVWIVAFLFVVVCIWLFTAVINSVNTNQAEILRKTINKVEKYDQEKVQVNKQKARDMARDINEELKNEKKNGDKNQ